MKRSTLIFVTFLMVAMIMISIILHTNGGSIAYKGATITINHPQNIDKPKQHSIKGANQH